jgi:hypothetical protein
VAAWDPGKFPETIGKPVILVKMESKKSRAMKPISGKVSLSTFSERFLKEGGRQFSSIILYFNCPSFLGWPPIATSSSLSSWAYPPSSATAAAAAFTTTPIAAAPPPPATTAAATVSTFYLSTATVKSCHS